MPSKKKGNAKKPSNNNRNKKPQAKASIVKSRPRQDVGQIGSYQMALTKPFSSASYGARVPDLWSAPTTTSHIRKLVTLSTTNTGTVTGLIIPNLCTHAVLSEGSISGVGAFSWTKWDGTSTPGALLSTEATGVKAKLSNARIVSYGVRFRNQAALSNVSGRFTVATIPIKDDMISPNAGPIGGSFTSNAGDTVGAWYAAAGVPYNGTGAAALIDSGTLTSLPNNMTVSSLQMNEVGLDVVPKVITPYAFGLKNTSDSIIGNDVGPGIATGSIYAGDDDYLKFGGFESVIFSASGLPANTAAMTLEVIYHVEGTPTIAADGGLVPDAAPKSQVSMAMFHRALDYAASAATFVAPVLTGAARGAARGMSNLPL